MNVRAVDIHGQYVLFCEACNTELKPDEDGDAVCVTCKEVIPQDFGKEGITLIPAHPWPHKFYKEE